jgi:tetratricopeptide (TPR) repeat protein
VADNNAGRPAEAERTLRAALDLLDRAARDVDPRAVATLRCNTLITLALTEFLLEGLDAAERRFAEVASIVDELADDDLRARLAYQRANVDGRAGNLAAAASGIDLALERPSAFTPLEQCSVLLSRGMLAYELSDPHLALDSFTAAGRLAEEHGFPAQAFMARHNEGFATYLLGDLPKALALLASADAMETQVGRGPAQLDRGQVLLEAGLVTEAVEALTAGAAVIAGADGDGQDQVRAEFDLHLARAHQLLGRPGPAAAAAERARVGFERLGARAWAARAALVALVNELDNEEPHAPNSTLDPKFTPTPDSTSAPTRVIPSSTASSTPTGPLPTRVAPSSTASSPPAGPLPTRVAPSSTAEATAAAGASGPDEDRADPAESADRLVRTALELGDLRLADNARVAAAAALLDRGDHLGAAQRLAERGADPVSVSDELTLMGVEARVHAANQRQGEARRVLGRAARRLQAGMRGSASLDVRTARAVHGIRLSRLDLDLALQSGAAAALEALERWRSATALLPSLGRPDDEQLAQLTEQLRTVRRRLRSETEPPPQLEREADWLQRQIRSRDWALSAADDPPSSAPMRIREARSAVGRADRDFIWLFAHAGRLGGIGVIGGRAVRRDLLPLPAAAELAHRIRVDLRLAATRELGVLGPAVWGSLRESAALLDDAVIRPWGAKATGLVLVTCNEVSALPWALFPSLVGRPLTVARSLTAFARREPSVDPARTGSRSMGTSVHVSVGPAVARGSSEAAAVAAAWPGHTTVNNPSTGRALVSALSAPGLVHVAAHGTHEVQSPLFSSVALHDGPVFAHELQPSGVRADHVVLSACDVGTTTYRPGEESLGLAASVLSLGARSAVAAVSPVRDDVAAEVMAAHHRALAAGRPSDEALAAAIAGSHPASAAFLNLGGRAVC